MKAATASITPHLDSRGVRLDFGQFVSPPSRRLDVDGLLFSEMTGLSPTGVPRHTHEAAHLCLVTHGVYKPTARNASGPCSSWTVLFHPPATHHDDCFATDGGAVLMVSLSAERFRDINLQARLPEESIVLNGYQPGFLGAKWLSEFRQPDDISTTALESLALELLSDAGRISPAYPGSPGWLKRAQERIEDCHAEQITVRDIADSAGVHPVHLAREFRRFFRCSPADYIRFCRIDRARRRMLHRDISLTHVAQDVGFFDQSHFTRAFKRTTGITPTAFRKLISN